MPDINLREFQNPMMQSSETVRTVKPQPASRSILKRCEMYLKAAEKYQEANDRKAEWKRLDAKLRGDYGQSKDEPIVETIAADAFNTLRKIGVRRPHIKCRPKSRHYIAEGFGQVDNVRNAKYREAAINQEFERIKIHKQVHKSMLDGICPYGVGVLKMGWGIETATDPKGFEQITNEGLWVKRWRPSDFFPGVLGDDETSMPFVIWRFWIPKKKALANKLWNQDVVQSLTQSHVPKTLHSDEDMTYGAEIELLELFEVHHLEENWLAVMARNGADLVRAPYDNPYAIKGIHGAIYRPWELNDDFWGRTQSKMIEPQATIINASRQKLNKHTNAFGCLVIDRRDDAEQKNEQWKYTPYGGKLNNPGGKAGDIEVFNVPQASRDFYSVADIARADAQWVLGKSDMSYGQAPDMKATQAAIIDNNEGKMTSDMSEAVADVYRALAEKAGDLLVQNLSTEQMFYLSGELPDGINLFDEYTAADIVANVDHTVDVESMGSGNDQVKAQTIMNGLTAIADPNMGMISQEVQRRYDLVGMFVKAQKLNGVELDEFEKDEEPQAQQNDPFAENEHALAGGLLDDPLPGEEWHIPTHEAVAHATKDEEIARHVLKHRALAANTPQGVQMDQQQQMAAQGGQVASQGSAGGQMPTPTMQGMPQGAPPVQQAMPRGAMQQINPMMGGR